MDEILVNPPFAWRARIGIISLSIRYAQICRSDATSRDAAYAAAIWQLTKPHRSKVLSLKKSPLTSISRGFGKVL